MSHCRLCRAALAESDGLCPLCRSIHRLVRDFLAVPEHLRSWALDRSRCWSGILQDEVLKDQGQPVPKPNPEAAAKAKTYLAGLTPAPKSGSGGGARRAPPEEDRDSEEAGGREEEEESPVRARSSGVHRRKRSSSRRRSRSIERNRHRRRESRRREEGRREVGRRGEAGKEKKSRSEDSRRGERRRENREAEAPPEPKDPPPQRWRGPIPAKGRGKGKPAAVVAKARAKAPAVPVRGRAPRGGARPRRRRPAAEVEREEEDPKGLLEGEVLPANKVPLELLSEGLGVIVEGTYWGAEAKVCGKVKGIQIQRDGRREMLMSGEGTSHEDLLRWLSTPGQVPLRVHLCGDACDQRIDAHGLLHGRTVRLKKDEDVGTWAENMLGMEDELAGLRAAEAEAKEKAEEDKGHKKDPKIKKAKKRKSSSGEREESKKEKKSSKKRLKIEGRKDLNAVYKNTGLDPSPKVRKKIMKAVKKRVRKRKKRHSSSDSDGSGDLESGSSSLSSQAEELFEDDHKVRTMAKIGPGSLTAAMVKEMQTQLLTSTGTPWTQAAGEVPAITLQYFRQVLSPRMTGGQAREALTLSFTLDKMLQGDIAGAADGLAQRLKALDLMSTGSSWMVAQKVELVPPEKGSLSTQAETLVSSGQGVQGRPEDKGDGKREGTRQRRFRLLLERERKERRKRKEREERRQERSKRGREEVRIPREGKKDDGSYGDNLLERGGEERCKKRMRGSGEELQSQGAHRSNDLLSEGGAQRLSAEPRGVKFQQACDGPIFSSKFSEALQSGAGHSSGASSTPAEDGSHSLGDLADDPLPTSALERDRPSLEKKSVGSFDMAGQGLEAVRALEGRSLSCTAPLIGSLLKKYDGMMWHSKTQSTGDIFPLPTGTEQLRVHVDLVDVEFQMLVNLVMALNSYAGVKLISEKRCTTLQVKFVKELALEVSRMCGWQECFKEISWDSFFKYRGVDYAGGCRSYVLDFENYLLDEANRKYTKPPRVMVADSEWEGVCRGLMASGICQLMPESSLAKVGGKPLLNGLFGVSKGEVVNGHEVRRLIMNLVPLNNISRGIQGDIATLPSWSAATPLTLLPHENLVVSSEDVRCFFYIFKLPSCWYPYLGFNKAAPAHLHPHSSERHYLTATVLPMGFKNSVSLAQHVHRVVLARAASRVERVLQPQQEMRKDRIFSSSEHLHRIYLDNFDAMQKMDSATADLVAGKPSVAVLALRQEYQHIGIPINEKKSVSQSMLAEVQGALVDGRRGIAMPKPEKVLKYVQLTMLLLHQARCSQRQVQVVAGGLVYMATFRRNLMGSLNFIWQFVEEFNKHPVVIHLEIPALVRLELVRFLALLPLARMSFRYVPSPVVTASDASTQGGGVTVSTGLTNAGQIAASCPVRGDIVELDDSCSVLTVGLFDGIGALRVAADAAGLPICGHISIEANKSASRVLESKFPATLFYDDVVAIDRDIVKQWACQYTMASVVVVGAGPPCQGVSGLNVQRRGALRDHRSKLYVHVDRITQLVKEEFKWAQVHSLAESVASMDEADRWHMSTSFGHQPWSLDASGVSLARRPRLYWCSWEISATQGSSVDPPKDSEIHTMGTIELTADITTELDITPGWIRGSEAKLPTFTTARPRPHPGRKPAGVNTLNEEEYLQWVEDEHRFPPYQYQLGHQLWRGTQHRMVNIEEKEVIMGFPRGYTVACLPKSQQGSVPHTDLRHTLIGNTWNVTVIVWLLSQLGAILGVSPLLTPQQCVDRTKPGAQRDLPTFLSRPRLGHTTKKITPGNEQVLVNKLTNMVSIKGEDLLLSSSTEETLKYHRLRASIPSNLWRWRIVSGWRWRGDREHINVLELRAVLCALRWRILKGHAQGQKLVHLTDSLVCLHTLTRGRTSSKKLRRTLSRINALLLLSNNVGVWTYVHTSLNPADAPSREHHKKRKWARK
eukprot:Skav214889  [mRNA]  locus=scaffold1749:153337:159325:+ [translate_table: standard]